MSDKKDNYDTCTADEYYFDRDQEDVLHDAFLMINSSDTEYETLREVILGETRYGEESLEVWEE